MPAHWQVSDDDDFDTPRNSAIVERFKASGSSLALKGIGSGRRKAPLGTAFTANFVHIYWKFCSCLLEILFMFTGNFVHVYRK
jgi:hypothetical protein